MPAAAALPPAALAEATPAPAPAPAPETTTPVKADPVNAEPVKEAPAQVDPAKATPAKEAPAQVEAQEQRIPAKRTPRKTTEPTAVEVKAPADIIPAQPKPPTTAPIPSTPEPEANKMAPHRTEAWAQLVADPGHAPELLALAAVQTIGPRAQQWVRRVRERYPTATDDAIARLAMKQFTRFGSVSGIFGAVAGSYAPIALLGAAALTHAELVLHVAAAYGQDPTAEERATDLLVLTRVHPDRPAAEAALAAAKQPAYEDDAKLSDALWRFGRMAATQAGSWTAIRLINRFFPGTSLLAATLSSRSSTETVAARARALYSQESQSLGSSV